MESIYKRIFIRRLYGLLFSPVKDARGPIANLILLCYKHGLIGFVLDAIESGCYMEKEKWGQMIKLAVFQGDCTTCRITCRTYKSLDRVFWSGSIEISSWWKFAVTKPAFLKQCRTIMKLLLAPAKTGSTLCQKCLHYERDTYEHIFFQCESVKDVSSLVWQDVIHECPVRLGGELNHMNDKEKVNFMLNGLNNSFVPEWSNVFEKVAIFICTIWTDYSSN